MTRVKADPSPILIAVAMAVGAASCGADSASDSEPDEPLSCEPEAGQELFERRIAPLLADDRPSSCNQCHLAGLDLGSFARGTPCQTMACMAEQGLVDLDQPEASLVLSWIERAEPQSDLITEDVIAQEYEAMRSWIEFSARCGDEACEPMEDPCEGGSSWMECNISGDPADREPFVDPGDCSEPTLEALFADRVYAWRGRCFPCHFQGEGFNAPHWIDVGPCEVGASRTMKEVLSRGLIDPADPGSSLLLLKPLDEQAGGLFHGGHNKISKRDEAIFQDFESWIMRFSQCQQ